MATLDTRKLTSSACQRTRSHAQTPGPAKNSSPAARRISSHAVSEPLDCTILDVFHLPGFRGLSEAEGSSILQRSGILEAMKHMLNLYLLGGVLTLLSIFIRLMESLEGLLESPSPGSSWATRGQLANTEPPRAFQTIHPEGCDKTSLHRL